MAAPVGRPGAVGGGVLAYELDDAPDRPAVRGLALGRAPRRRLARALLALAPVRKRRLDQVAIVDGTLVPTRDRRVAASSKNYRYSTNLQIAIDADSRLVIATSDPHPGNRNDTTVYRDSGMDQKLAGRTIIADGGYRGNPEVIIPYRKHSADQDLPPWQDQLNTTHRRIRARIEHPGRDEDLESLAGLPACRGHPRRHRLRNCPPPQPRPHRLNPTPRHTNHKISYETSSRQDQRAQRALGSKGCRNSGRCRFRCRCGTSEHRCT